MVDSKAPWYWIGPIAMFPHDGGLMVLNSRHVLIKEWRFAWPRWSQPIVFWRFRHP